MTDKPADVPTRNRYKIFCRALNIEERKETVLTPDPNDATKRIHKEVSLGWFVRVNESSAIHLGNDKPDFVKGDELELTIMRSRRK